MLYNLILAPRIHVSTIQWGHHQACIIKLKMYVHERLACHPDGMLIVGYVHFQFYYSGLVITPLNGRNMYPRC
jgi:hypothetical protein